MSELQAPSAPRAAATSVPVQARWTGRVSLGSRIRNARVAAGMTEAALAEGLTSIAYLSRIEANERRPTPALLAALAERLDVAAIDLTRSDSPTVVGLRFELAHTDLLLASEQYNDAALVGGDLAEVAARIGSVEVADAARIAQASALAAAGHRHAALQIVRPLAGGPMGLPAMVAEARFRLELSDLAGAITVGHHAATRVASGEDLSVPEGTALANTLCSAYRAFGRHHVAAQIALLALRHVPADEDLQGDELQPSEAASIALSYRNFDHAGRQIERAIAALQLSRFRADIASLRTYSPTDGNPEAATGPGSDGQVVR